MKNLCLLSLLLVVFACNPVNNPGDLPGDNDSIPVDTSLLTLDQLFDITTLPHITVKVTEKDWNTLLSNFDINEKNEEAIPASFSLLYNNQTVVLDSIGLRLRGNTSRRRPEGSYGEKHNSTSPNFHHAHFGLKFAEYKSKQRIGTTDRIVLKWFKDDPTYTREVYCYDLFKRFKVYTAPRVTYTRLTIEIEGDPKPAYFGVYAMIEAIGDDYLTDRQKSGYFKGDNGNLWKCSWGADFKNSDPSRMGVEDITLNPNTMKTYVYDLKTNKKKGVEAAKSQLQSFITALNSKSGSDLQTWLEANMDVDLFLRAYAVNVMVGMWDDYWVNQNNFYFYFDENGKFYFIPYDYDNTLGTSSILNNSGTQNLLYWGDTNNRPLIAKVLSIPAYKEKYKQYIKELANSNNDYFYTDKSMARIKNWQNKIKPYVSNDTGEDMSIYDEPASWGNCGFYRVLSGNDAGGANGNANFFSTKIKSINF